MWRRLGASGKDISPETIILSNYGWSITKDAVSIAPRRLASVVLLFCLLPIATPAAEEVKTIESRPGVTLRYVQISPEHPSHTAVLLFPGGYGARSFIVGKDNSVKMGENFLTRVSRDLAREGFHVVVVDVPSDQSGGMGEGFRKSPAHRTDIEKLVQTLTDGGIEGIFLVGTSMSTISIAYLGSTLASERIRGIVLTSTMSYNDYLRSLHLDRNRYPVLMIHHTFDECKVTPFYEAKKTAEALSKGSRVDFVQVNGGTFARGVPCGPLSAHGFLGIEEKIVKILTEWMQGKTKRSG
jgi:dienelactone hydrolase